MKAPRISGVLALSFLFVAPVARGNELVEYLCGRASAFAAAAVHWVPPLGRILRHPSAPPKTMVEQLSPRAIIDDTVTELNAPGHLGSRHRVFGRNEFGGMQYSEHPSVSRRSASTTFALWYRGLNPLVFGRFREYHSGYPGGFWSTFRTSAGEAVRLFVSTELSTQVMRQAVGIHRQMEPLKSDYRKPSETMGITVKTPEGNLPSVAARQEFVDRMNATIGLMVREFGARGLADVSPGQLPDSPAEPVWTPTNERLKFDLARYIYSPADEVAMPLHWGDIFIATLYRVYGLDAAAFKKLQDELGSA